MVSEYVIKGNTAVLKCNIPSFVADFVRVEAWLGSDGTEFTSTTDFGIENQATRTRMRSCSVLFCFVLKELT